jgi:hypothetical protein
MSGSDDRHIDPTGGKSDVSPSGPGVSSKMPRVNPGNDEKFQRVVPAETGPVRDTPPPDDLKHPTRAP